MQTFYNIGKDSRGKCYCATIVLCFYSRLEHSARCPQGFILSLLASA